MASLIMTWQQPSEFLRFFNFSQSENLRTFANEKMNSSDLQVPPIGMENKEFCYGDKALVKAWVIDLEENHGTYAYFASSNPKIEVWTLFEDDAWTGDTDDVFDVYAALCEKEGKIIRIGRKLYRLESVNISLL